MIAKIKINNNFQKSSITYRQLLSDNVLKDICIKVTGQDRYNVEFLDETNVGRLVTIKYKGVKNYVTLSETDFNKGRNSAMQSAASALTRFYLDDFTNKNIYFYFLDFNGNPTTSYLTFMYRLLKTSGIIFLNDNEKLGFRIQPFNSLNDIIVNRGYMKKRQNFSSYITKSASNEIEVYAKTYGANKKEATILCTAMAKIDNSSITVYQVKEKKLTVLPKPDRTVMKKLGVKLEQIDKELTRESETNHSLRSTIFIYNMLRIRGAKKCAWCDCNVPEIIEGAHIWPVYKIKGERSVTDEDKRKAAVDGENGIWLCRNHHKLFDAGIITINKDNLKLKINPKYSQYLYIQSSVLHDDASDYIDSDESLDYLNKRYQ